MQHPIPLLSLGKTKMVSELVAFLKKHATLLILKLDGLTVKLVYEDGKLIQGKLRPGIPLADDDLMRLVILLLTVPGTEGKQDMLERIVELAEQIPDEGQRIFTLSGVIVASDKFINRDYMDQIRRRINMTQLGQLYEKEKLNMLTRR